MFKKNEKFVDDFAKSMLAPLVPLFLVQMNCVFEAVIDMDPVLQILKMPQAKIANVNAHQFLTGISPWGSINDLELIN